MIYICIILTLLFLALLLAISVKNRERKANAVDHSYIIFKDYSASNLEMQKINISACSDSKLTEQIVEEKRTQELEDINTQAEPLPAILNFED